jgi:hypothetical protein
MAMKNLREVAPPGREKQVLELKKKFPKGSSSPFKIAWSQYNKKNEGTVGKDKNEAVMSYGAPARNLGHQDVKKPSGYGSAARGGDGNGLGASSVSKPAGYGAPAKDLTPGTKVGGKAVKVESTAKPLRDIIGE